MQLTLKELFEKSKNLGDKEAIIDVRNPDEYAEGHIAGSRNCPLPNIAQYVDELKSLDKVFIHCQRGGRAQKAFDALQQKGLNNVICCAEGGMAEWKDAGYPVESS